MATTPLELPPGSTIEEGPGGVTITSRRPGPMPVMGAAVAVILALRVDLLQLGDAPGTSPLDGGFFYTTGIGAAMAAAMAYGWLERTVYTVNARRVSVRRRPSLGFGGCTVGTADVERLEVVVARSRANRAARHTLRVHLRDGSTRELVKGSMGPELPEYLLGTVERFRRRPPGWLRSWPRS